MKKIILCLCCFSFLLLNACQEKEKTQDPQITQPWKETDVERLDFDDFALTSYTKGNKAYRYVEENVVYVKVMNEKEEIIDQFEYHKENRALLHTHNKQVSSILVSTQCNLMLNEQYQITQIQKGSSQIPSTYEWTSTEDPIFSSYQSDGSQLPAYSTTMSFIGVLKNKESGETQEYQDTFTYQIEQK